MPLYGRTCTILAQIQHRGRNFSLKRRVIVTRRIVDCWTASRRCGFVRGFHFLLFRCVTAIDFTIVEELIERLAAIFCCA
uniref:Uncharacterized protein n=1 Tax=Onchocerca volvulus TaxID=6282 RepID=A0A8R1TYW9_ONCVO